ncbi:MAG: hemerythrin domain-containing protein [Chloroflexi bacterium]|nr:hemerythrin domain-containing protein [Chloroflexota bacterium]
MTTKEELKLDLTHPIGVMMAEHEVILRTLKELRGLVIHLWGGNTLDSNQLVSLKTIAHRLLDAELHHQREEQALFPRLEKIDPSVPVQMLMVEHDELRNRKKKLVALADGADTSSPKFLEEVAALAGFINNNLGAHIDKEDNDVFPRAVRVIEASDWDKIKDECNQIGYCSFTPPLPAR